MEVYSKPEYLYMLIIIALLFVIMALAIIFRRTKSKSKNMTVSSKVIAKEKEIGIISQKKPKPPIDPPPELIKILSSGECILFVGGGLSNQSGLPIWRQIIKGLLNDGIQKEKIGSDDATVLLKSLRTGNVEAVTNELVHHLSSDFIKKYLNTNLEKAKPSTSHRIIRDFNFAGCLTTNYDNLLDATFEKKKIKKIVPSGKGDFVEILYSKDFFILNLYGSLETPDSIIITQRELQEALDKNLQLSQFIETIYKRYSLFFIGTSIRSIKEFFQVLPKTQSISSNKKHFALVGENADLDEVEVRYLEREYNIQIIDFIPEEGYPELNDFLFKCRSSLSVSKLASSKYERPILKRVVLQNIGPFEKLDIEINPSWNMILGDNGTGKTIILKAIAAALCGEATDDEAAKRLLNTNSEWGEIKLITEKREYAVELKRNIEGLVNIESASFSPIRVDNWLVIGFPAIRSVTFDRPEGPTEIVNQYPSPTDLLPILTGEPDTRLNNLKQWIINLDYLSSGKDSDAKRAKKQLSRFFEILNIATPGIELRSKTINKKTQEILLITNGDTVPIELVSQGTISVICWVGTILQRLYEAHAKLEQPEDGGALILLDEIGAHMHPLWQREITGILKEIFPKVQFIVSTHSPLVILGLEPDEIFVANRAEIEESAERKIIIKKPQIDLRRWRADQVLTSPIFNLTSTIDPKIHKAIERYTELSTLDKISVEEKKELEQVTSLLNISPPSPLEKEEARLVFEKLEDALNEQLENLPVDKQKRMLKEAKAQIQESITGSRRP